MKHKHQSLKDAISEAKKIMDSGEVPSDDLVIIRDYRYDTYYLEVDDGIFIRNFEEIVHTF